MVIGSVENECTSNLFVGDIQITDRDVGSCMGGDTYFVSYPKGDFKSELQSPFEPPKEEENMATPLGCEPTSLVEEHATKVSVQGEGHMKDMEDNGSDFFSSNYHLQPSDSWDIEKITLSYEDCRMKDNVEGKEFSPSFFVGEHQISPKEGDVVHDDKVSFGSDPKEEQI